jgi:hypothetical protein
MKEHRCSRPADYVLLVAGVGVSGRGCRVNAATPQTPLPLSPDFDTGALYELDLGRSSEAVRTVESSDGSSSGEP